MEDVELKKIDMKNYTFFKLIVASIFCVFFLNTIQAQSLEAKIDKILTDQFKNNESFYNFMFVLLQQNSPDGGGPFETQPAIGT